MIEVRALSKRFGSTLAVDGLSFEVLPGRVTGFLGPNGAGKTTTLRAILGLARPSAGTATVVGLPYRQLDRPLRQVGALLDARAVDGARTAAAHLRWITETNDLPGSRVDEVLGMVGLRSASAQRVGSFSLGMCQRLGVAAALLGDPDVLILDEPANGLDTDGIRWLRAMLRSMAAEGRTVLVSSHLMDEMERSADHLVVIARGRLLANTTMADLAPQRGTLEDVYMRMVSGLIDHRGHAPTTTGLDKGRS